MLRGQAGESGALSREVLELGPGGDTLAAGGPWWIIDNLVPELSAAVDELSLRSGGNLASAHPIATMGIPLLALADREPTRALRLFDVYATSDDPWVRAAAPFFRGVFGAFLGDTAKAEAAIRQAVAAYRAIGDSWGIAVALIQLAECAGGRGGDISQVGNVIDAIAALVQPDGPDPAAPLLGAAHTVRGVFDESSLDAPAVRGAARRALGDAAFDAAYQQGRELGYDAAVALTTASVAQVLRR